MAFTKLMVFVLFQWFHLVLYFMLRIFIFILCFYSKALSNFVFKSCYIKKWLLLLNAGFYFYLLLYLPPMYMHCACVRGDTLSVVCVAHELVSITLRVEGTRKGTRTKGKTDDWTANQRSDCLSIQHAESAEPALIRNNISHISQAVDQ